MSVDRIPPSNLEAEMAVLGSVMVQNDQMNVALEYVRPDDFYAHVHEATFKLFAELHGAGEPIDKITVVDAMRSRGVLEKLGGLAYLNGLIDVAPTAANTIYYAKIVAEKAALRRLIAESRKLNERAHDETLNPVELAADTATALDVAVRLSQHDDGTSIGAAGYQLIESLYDGGPLWATESPWPTVNAKTGGWVPGEVVVWGANPGTGKTGAMVCLADWVARREHAHVAIFALEMDVKPTIVRFLSLYTNVASKDIRRAKWRTKDDENRVIEANTDLLAPLPITMFGKLPEKSVFDVRLACRKLKREHPNLRAVIIDHIGFLTDVTRPGRESKHERLDAAYKGIIALASELGVVVHVVQHMNRDAADKPGSMFDLRDGGNVEGNASCIILMHRPTPAGTPEEQRLGVFKIEKCREGEKRMVEVMFEGQRGLWRETQEANENALWWRLPPPQSPEIALPPPRRLARFVDISSAL